MAFTCEEVRNRFSALWEKALNPPEEAEARRHLEGCPDCREGFARFDRTLRMLHSVEDAEVPEGFLSGIYQKIEERKDGGLTAEKIPKEGYARWKVPAQAAAMIAIILVAVYLTRIIPGQSPRMKAVEEPKPSPPAVKEEKWDRLQARDELEKAEKEVIVHLAKEPGAAKAEEKQETIPSEASGPKPELAAPPALQKMKPDAGLEDGTAEERIAERKGNEGSGAPRPANPETKRSEQSPAARGGISPGPVPSEKFVVRSSDREKSLSDLRQLVKKFGGEILTAEPNAFLVSLPRSSLAEFGKELEGIGPPSEPHQAVSSSIREKDASIEKGSKRELSQKKYKEIKPLDALKEGRAVVRIVLSEE